MQSEEDAAEVEAAAEGDEGGGPLDGGSCSDFKLTGSRFFSVYELQGDKKKKQQKTGKKRKS